MGIYTKLRVKTQRKLFFDGEGCSWQIIFWRSNYFFFLSEKELVEIFRNDFSDVALTFLRWKNRNLCINLRLESFCVLKNRKINKQLTSFAI